MNVSTIPGYHDPLGLFWYAAWLAGHGFFMSLLLCLLLAPIAMMLIAPVGETRWLPLGKKQFRSFFPGTLYLGLATALLLLLAGELPYDPRWYNSFWWHLVVQFGALIGAALMTRGDRKIYEPRALWSPTKVFNNVLYAFWGYVFVTTFVAVLFGSAWTFWFMIRLAVTCFIAYRWLRLVRRVNRLRKEDPDAYARIVATAHDADWQPVWKYLKARRSTT